MWLAGSDKAPEDLQWSSIEQAIAVSQLGNDSIYFFAPKKFLGDQRFIYNQEIIFTLKNQYPYLRGGWTSKYLFLFN